MTIQNAIISLWDNGIDKFYLVSVPPEDQYKYISGKPCITVGFAYEYGNGRFKGYDTFTLFDHFYIDILEAMKKTYRAVNGSFRLYDLGADSDGYVDFNMENGKLHVEGRLGATFSSHALKFEFDADQTLLEALIRSLTI